MTLSVKPTVKIRILDEVNCAIIGLKPDHHQMLYEKYGIYAPNYFFNPKFKMGSWDGKIRYFQRNGKTYVYLLNEMIPIITKLGYAVELDDQRFSFVPDVDTITDQVFSHVEHPESGQQIILRNYQVEAVNTLIQAKGGVVIAATGAGKTFICAALAQQHGLKGMKTLTIVPSKDLIEQTAVEYELCQLDTGRYYGDVKDINHDHLVSTWQSLKNNPMMLNGYDVVIVDECHGIKGKVLQEILNDYGNHIALRYGVTGTMPKAETDAMAVRVSVGDVRYTISAATLMDQGHLASLNIDVLQLTEDFREQFEEYKQENPNEKITYTQFKDGFFPDYTSEKNYLQTNKQRVEWIADFLDMKRDMKKGNVFCLVDGVRFGQKLAEAIPNAIFVYGKDKQKARKQVYDLFKDNDNLVVIATIHIASTGLNIKRIFNLVFIDVGKSFVRVIQTIGRGLRKADDKDSVDVVDICSDLKYSKRHVAERIKFYKEANYPYKKKKVDYTNVDI